MSDGARDRGAPQPVTSLVGIVVALVAAVFGVCAHGLAAGPATPVPDAGTLVQVALGAGLVGALTAGAARRLPVLPTAAAGLLAGQGLTHLVLVVAHSGPHGAAAHVDHLAAHTGSAGAAAESAAVRAAMDAAGDAGHARLGWAMVLAHLGAIALTLVVLGLLAAALSWLAARVVPLLGGVLLPAPAVVPRAATPPARPSAVFLVGRGGTRAPPVTV